MGNFVPFDGHQRSAHLPGSAIQCPDAEFAALWHAAGIQLFLEHHLFQPAKLRLCICLVAGAVRADFVDDSRLPQGGYAGCMVTGALSAMGYLCSLPEFRRMDAKSVAEKRKV